MPLSMILIEALYISRVARVTELIRATDQLVPGRVGFRVSSTDPVPSLPGISQLPQRDRALHGSGLADS